jgi:hypothetical protein
VAKGVVDAFEMVEVDQHQRQRGLGALGALQLAQQAPLEHSAGVRAGEGVEGGRQERNWSLRVVIGNWKAGRIVIPAGCGASGLEWVEHWLIVMTPAIK